MENLNLHQTLQGMASFSGFSKLSKEEKVDIILSRYFHQSSSEKKELLKSFWHKNAKFQKIFDEFSENTLSNYFFPMGVVPNFILNDKEYCIPMVIEESSVVAACARSAKFWNTRGGVKTKVLGTEKIGQVTFYYSGKEEILDASFEKYKHRLIEAINPLQESMQARGGGLLDLKLKKFGAEWENHYQFVLTFNTCDAMGANFINTILEAVGREFKCMMNEECPDDEFEIIMAILSNYTPNCKVRAWVECSLDDLNGDDLPMPGPKFAQKMAKACKLAYLDTYRAATHNKGIFNGVDAVILATGNDFRATEACGHVYAARDGKYRGLTSVEIKDNKFIFSIELPLSVGTVGGLTSLHPLARFSLELMGSPSAPELMQIAAAVGLAQNFGALRSLVTSGIQKGHMKMHLINILNHLEASEDETEKAKVFFEDKVVSFKSVKDFISSLRNYH